MHGGGGSSLKKSVDLHVLIPAPVQSTAVRSAETNTRDCDCEKEERGTSEITLRSHLPCVSFL